MHREKEFDRYRHDAELKLHLDLAKTSPSLYILDGMPNEADFRQSDYMTVGFVCFPFHTTRGFLQHGFPKLAQQLPWCMLLSLASSDPGKSRWAVITQISPEVQSRALIQ